MWWDEHTSRRWLDDAAAERLRQRIVASEARHRSEIRVCVEAALPVSWWWPLPARDVEMAMRVRARALEWFGRLGVWDTEDNAGVLIYLLLAERAIELVADRGLARRVTDAQWSAVLAILRAGLQRGQTEAALAAAIDAVDAWLVEHFGAVPGQPNPNELPDAVVRV